VGEEDGISVGSFVGVSVGMLEGEKEGATVGATGVGFWLVLGARVVGSIVLVGDSDVVGSMDASAVGSRVDGATDGALESITVGPKLILGSIDGELVSIVGKNVGETEGPKLLKARVIVLSVNKHTVNKYAISSGVGSSSGSRPSKDMCAFSPSQHPSGASGSFSQRHARNTNVALNGTGKSP